MTTHKGKTTRSNIYYLPIVEGADCPPEKHPGVRFRRPTVREGLALGGLEIPEDENAAALHMLDTLEPYIQGAVGDWSHYEQELDREDIVGCLSMVDIAGLFAALMGSDRPTAEEGN